MEENLLPLLLFGGGGAPGPLGGFGEGLLPLLLFSGRRSGSCTDSSCCSSACSSSPALESELTNQLKRYKGCRVKLVLATSTFFRGGQMVIATIRDVQEDYILIDHIEIDGVPSLDPSFLLLGREQIAGVQPIPYSHFLFETLWKVQAFRSGCCTTL